MSTVLSDTVQKARKDYRCDACAVWLSSRWDQIDVSNDDWEIVVAAEVDKWKILKGQPYRKLVYVDSGEIRTYRARKGMNELCNNHELFDE